MLIAVCFSGRIYARDTIDKIVNLMEENQRLDREIIKLMRFELSNEVKNTPKLMLKDNYNRLWMFKFYKSSVPVNNSIAAYQTASLCGVQTPCIYEVMLPFNGKLVYGSIQSFVNDARTISSIYPWMLSKKQIKIMQRCQVFDYFICNPDIGGDNFLIKLDKRGSYLSDIKKGDIIAVDKDTSFYKIFNSPYDGIWNDNDPYYKRIWEAYTEEKIDVDFSGSFQLIDYIQQIDAERIEDLLRPFFRGRETFLKEVISRKDKLRSTFEKFYQDLANKRGEHFQSQIVNKEEYARIVLKKIKKIVSQKKKRFKYLQSESKEKQKNIEIIFHREGFNKAEGLENVLRKDIDIKARKVLEELKMLRKNSLNLYEKLALSLYIYEVENVLRRRPLEFFLNNHPLEKIDKDANNINVAFWEYTFRTFYGLSRRIHGKILKDFDYHSQDILKHLNFIQSPVYWNERKIIFTEYEKQIGHNSVLKFIGGMLFNKIEYLKKIKGDFEWKYLGKGMIYWLYEERDKAMQEYKKAITLSEDKTIKFFGYRLLGFINEYNYKGVRFGRGFNIDEAIANYKKALEIKPGSVEAYLNLGSLYLIKSVPEEALRQFKEIERLVPQYAREHFHLDKIKEKNLYESKEKYLEAIRMNTLSGEHHYVLGLAYAVKRQSELAKKHFGQARKFGYETHVGINGK